MPWSSSAVIRARSTWRRSTCRERDRGHESDGRGPASRRPRAARQGGGLVQGEDPHQGGGLDEGEDPYQGEGLDEGEDPHQGEGLDEGEDPHQGEGLDEG